MLDPGTARKLINPHMPVVGSSGARFATVDHLEGSDMIKLTRDDSGQHHYIPLEWVTQVDDEVHIDRPREQAMKEWTTSASTEAARSTETTEPAAGKGTSTSNSIEEMRGQPLAARVKARVAELEQALADLEPDETVMRREIEQTLATVESLSTGDISHPPDAVAAQLSEWLERNRHLGLKADAAAASEPAPADREQ